ncbi:MAG: glycosyltransferase [Clostridiales bacterium]|nr:glycosyltransferase [Clostridiales bacterium]
MRILAIVPCYNEAQSLKRTVDRLREAAPEVDFIVVDDGSRDRTGQVCADNGYPVITMPFNLGLANAVQTGMRYARANGYDMALQYDGDGQHKPEYIGAMARLMGESSADVVVGSRYMADKPRGLRGLGGKLLGAAIRVTTGQSLTDPTSGFRLYNRDMIGRFADHMNYGPEPDTLAYLMKRGARIVEVPVVMAERTAGRSYLNALAAANYMLRMFVSIIIIHWFRI